MRIVFILSVDLTEVGKEMEFLTGCLGDGVNLLKVVWLQRGSETSSPPTPAHFIVGFGRVGCWDRPRIMGGLSLPNPSFHGPPFPT